MVLTAVVALSPQILLLLFAAADIGEFLSVCVCVLGPLGDTARMLVLYVIW